MIRRVCVFGTLVVASTWDDTSSFLWQLEQLDACFKSVCVCLSVSSSSFYIACLWLWMNLAKPLESFFQREKPQTPEFKKKLENTSKDPWKPQHHPRKHFQYHFLVLLNQTPLKNRCTRDSKLLDSESPAAHGWWLVQPTASSLGFWAGLVRLGTETPGKP